MKAAFRLCCGLLLLGFLHACKTTPPAISNSKEEASAAKPRPRQARQAAPPVRISETRSWDLIHTRLEVDFDWELRRLNGNARLHLSPLFYPQDSIHLDAKGFEIHSVEVAGAAAKHAYDLRNLVVYLPRSFQRGDTLILDISYTARPYELEKLGLDEDAEEHGLYFVNADGKQEGYPQQIWTQGETEANSCWFPTIDQPNERCTQEMLITVQDRFKTLSNGTLQSQEALPGGKRRDHWVMRQPHAPYLFMMAIGEFAVVKDEWRGKEVSYWVEPEYEPFARMIFGNTPEMMEFFSEKLGVEYPWDKYAQVVVQEFVSGAMENTSATIHFEKLQHNDRQHLEDTYEEYISHELFHQWFGDLVTCESWSHLTLNEAFATYGEFLWIEYKYGDEEAAEHFLGDRQIYFYEAGRRIHPLIHFRYRNRESMFDGHSYHKGGQVLHMLRHEVGDAAFFASLQRYLEENAFTDVEADELRLAFEDVTGRDLRWFFDQWFFQAGHPQLRVVHHYQPGKYSLRVTQLQDSASQPTFQFPVKVAISTGIGYEERDFRVSSRDTVLEFRAAFPPDMVDFNSDGVLLAEVLEEKPAQMWLQQVEQGGNYHQRRAAVLALEQKTLAGDTLAALLSVLQDESLPIKFLGLRWSEGKDNLAVQRAMLLLLDDPDANVRGEAIFYFRSLDEGVYPALKSELLDKLEMRVRDRSYSAQQRALFLITQLDSARGLALAKGLIPEAEGQLLPTIALMLAQANDPGAMPMIEAQLAKIVPAQERIGYVHALSELWEQNGSMAGKDLLMELAAEDPVWWVRLTAARSLNRMDKDNAWQDFYRERAAAETEPMLKDFWNNLVD